jgi:hypothetical protein
MEEEKQFQNLSGAAIRNQTVEIATRWFLAKNFLTFVFCNIQKMET